MMVKAPKLNMHQLEALKTLVRLDFTRAVRFSLEKRKPDEHVAESTRKVLTLTDYLLEAEQPLVVTAALMQIHGSVEALLPLQDRMFNFYASIIAAEVGTDDFPTVAADQLEPILAPLKLLQAQLAIAFRDATLFDPESIKKGVVGGTDPKPAVGGMKN